MIEFELKVKGGGGAKIILPASVSEMTINEYVEFMVELWAIKDGNENPISCMARAVSAVSGTDIRIILQGIAGKPDAQNEQGYQRTVCALFEHIAKIIQEYTPQIRLNEDRVFTMPVTNAAGDEVEQIFTIPGYALNGLLANPQIEDLPTFQAIEVMEIQRLYLAAVEKDKDRDGSFLYTHYVETLTILARAENEKFPETTSQLDAWLEQRKYLFADAPADVCLDVDFFLFSTFASLNPDQRTVGFLTLCRLNLMVEMRKLNVRYMMPK